MLSLVESSSSSSSSSRAGHDDCGGGAGVAASAPTVNTASAAARIRHRSRLRDRSLRPTTVAGRVAASASIATDDVVVQRHGGSTAAAASPCLLRDAPPSPPPPPRSQRDQQDARERSTVRLEAAGIVGGDAEEAAGLRQRGNANTGSRNPPSSTSAADSSVGQVRSSSADTARTVDDDRPSRDLCLSTDGEPEVERNDVGDDRKPICRAERSATSRCRSGGGGGGDGDGGARQRADGDDMSAVADGGLNLAPERARPGSAHAADDCPSTTPRCGGVTTDRTPLNGCEEDALEPSTSTATSSSAGDCRQNHHRAPPSAAERRSPHCGAVATTDVISGKLARTD